MFKEQKGITLVALVITIIVLLILAGVSIALVLGNNGVLTQSKNAVAQNKAGAARQAFDMCVASCETDYMAEWSHNTSTKRAAFYAGEGLAEGKGFDFYLKGAGYTPKSSQNLQVSTDGTDLKYVVTENATGGSEITITYNVTNGQVVSTGAEVTSAE